MSADLPAEGTDGRLEHEIINLNTAPPHRLPVLKQFCYDLRIEVFVHEQGFSVVNELDEFRALDMFSSPFDDTATHLLLRLYPDLTPIGTVRIYRVAGTDYYKLSRLVVLKEYRKKKFGEELVAAAHEWVTIDARRSSLSSPVTVICHSQIPVKGFYEKSGYQAEGEEFIEDGQPHQKMITQVSFA